ncbi:MAG TPA: hypothetical protein VFI62_07675, partial [Burkholderiales bacterium]|nr:hypothetical protein [Burkholderiales bacterium]
MSSTTSYSGYICERPVPPVTLAPPAAPPAAARWRARLSARSDRLKARMESFGIHCHGCPDPGARAAVVVRTCALAIDGLSAASAIVEAMK